MNTEALFLFLILLLGLVLCSFLGGDCNREGLTGKFSGVINIDEDSDIIQNKRDLLSNGASAGALTNYDNYNHYTGGYTNLVAGSTFYGPNGSTALVQTDNRGEQKFKILLPGASKAVIFKPNKNKNNKIDTKSTVIKESYTDYSSYMKNNSLGVFEGPDGASAEVLIGKKGDSVIKVTTNTGTYYYSAMADTNSMNASANDGSLEIYWNGLLNTIMSSYNNLNTANANANANTTSTCAQNQSANATCPQNVNTPAPCNANAPAPASTNINAPATTNANVAASPASNLNKDPSGNNITSTQYFGATGSPIQTYPDASAYQKYTPYSTVSTPKPPAADLPSGIPQSKIPPGQEDLYILKSEIVPPVCPVCPTCTSSPAAAKSESCPPCPACARCPEPAFDCKKVPNYKAMNGGQYGVPTPFLNDFSQFGM